MNERMNICIFLYRDIFCKFFGIRFLIFFIFVVGGVRRIQRFWFRVVLEGFLEEEEKVEDGGLGVGVLSRDFMVGMCFLYLVSGRIQGCYGVLGIGVMGGYRVRLGGLDWQFLVCGFQRIIEGFVRVWLVRVGFWKRTVVRSQKVNFIFFIFIEFSGCRDSVLLGLGFRVGVIIQW